MRSARRLPYLLLALLLWSFGVPVLAVSCLPAAPCAELGLCPLAKRDAPAAELTVAAPDCCARSLREGGPPALPGVKLQPLAMAVPLPSAALLIAPSPPLAAPGPDAVATGVAAVPLYTLHSILLL